MSRRLYIDSPPIPEFLDPETESAIDPGEFPPTLPPYHERSYSTTTTQYIPTPRPFDIHPFTSTRRPAPSSVRVPPPPTARTASQPSTPREVPPAAPGMWADHPTTPPRQWSNPHPTTSQPVWSDAHPTTSPAHWPDAHPTTSAPVWSNPHPTTSPPNWSNPHSPAKSPPAPFVHGHDAMPSYDPTPIPAFATSPPPPTFADHAPNPNPPASAPDARVPILIHCAHLSTKPETLLLDPFKTSLADLRTEISRVFFVDYHYRDGGNIDVVKREEVMGRGETQVKEVVLRGEVVPDVGSAGGRREKGERKVPGAWGVEREELKEIVLHEANVGACLGLAGRGGWLGVVFGVVEW